MDAVGGMVVQLTGPVDELADTVDELEQPVHAGVVLGGAGSGRELPELRTTGIHSASRPTMASRMSRSRAS